MNCAECKELLIGFLEGLIDQAEKQRISEHIRSCADCTAELEKIEKLHKSLVRNGEALGESDLEAEVFNRILREQKEKLKAAGDSGQTINFWRLIMKSPIIKFAAAAVIIAAGLFFFTQPGSVALAEVAEKVRQFDSLIQRGKTIITIAGQQEPFMTTDTKKYVLADEGSVDEQYDQNGNLMTTVYVLKEKQQVIMVLKPLKQYLIIDLKGTAIEMPPSFDAKALVECFVLESNPVKLGQKEIDGRKAEGFEALNPKAIEEMSKLSNGMFSMGDNTWRLWVDVKTKLPIKVEGEFIMKASPMTNFTESNVEFETTSIEWGAEFDKSIFEPDIPDDYTLLDTSTPTK